MVSFVDFIQFLSTKAKVTDIATGQIMGNCISKASTSLVQDVISPVITVVTGGLTLDNHFIVIKRGEKYPYSTVSEAEQDGAIIVKYGNTAYAIFILLVQALILYFLIGAWRRCLGDSCALKRR